MFVKVCPKYVCHNYNFITALEVFCTFSMYTVLTSKHVVSTVLGWYIFTINWYIFKITFYYLSIALWLDLHKLSQKKKGQPPLQDFMPIVPLTAGTLTNMFMFCSKPEGKYTIYMIICKQMLMLGSAYKVMSSALV